MAIRQEIVESYATAICAKLKTNKDYEKNGITAPDTAVGVFMSEVKKDAYGMVMIWGRLKILAREKINAMDVVFFSKTNQQWGKTSKVGTETIVACGVALEDIAINNWGIILLHPAHI